MEFILQSVEAAANSGCPFAAVVTALTIPDIAGAVDAPGVYSQPRYVQWIETWFHPMFPGYADHGIDGSTLYGLRCKLLHEGRTDPSQARIAAKSPVAAKKRLIAFNAYSGLVMHLCTAEDATGESRTILRAETFCQEISAAARNWMSKRANDPGFQKLLQDLVGIRTDVPPLSKGVPLICAEL